MTIVVGYAPDYRGKAALQLAGMIARSSGERLHVCSVVPAAWYPSRSRDPSENQESMRTSA